MRRAERIVFFVTELGRGGAETQLVRVALSLRKRGLELDVLSLMPPVGYVNELEEAGIPVHDLGLARGRPEARALLEAARVVRARRASVVCCFLYHATLLGTAAARLGGCHRVVSSIRDPSFGGPRRLRLAGGLTRLGLVEAVVANSRRVGDSLRASGMFREGALRVIPNGLELPTQRLDPAARAALRASLGIGEREFFWLHVGNFQAPKDHPNLLEGFARARQARPEARLRMVGLGVPPPHVAARMAAEDLREAAAHLGERRDVPSLMEAADALVLASSSEGLPNVIMEAHAARTPVVATDVGGVRELLTPRRSGLLVPPRRADALGDAMVEMMEVSPEERARWAGEGRVHVEANYTIERVTDAWEALLAPR